MRVTIVIAPLDDLAERWATVMAEHLEELGCRVTIRLCTERDDPRTADGVVIASSLHDGRWAPHGVHYILTHQHTLASRPTWFVQTMATPSSGSPTSPSYPGTIESGDSRLPEAIAVLAARLGARTAPALVSRAPDPIDDHALHENCRQLSRSIVGILRRPDHTAATCSATGASTRTSIGQN